MHQVFEAEVRRVWADLIAEYDVEDVAAAAGVSTRTAYNWRAGTTAPSLERAFRVLRSLALSARSLGGHGPVPHNWSDRSVPDAVAMVTAAAALLTSSPGGPADAQAAARRAGVSKNTVYRMRRGAGSTRLDLLLRIFAFGLGLPPDHLFDCIGSVDLLLKNARSGIPLADALAVAWREEE